MQQGGFSYETIYYDYQRFWVKRLVVAAAANDDEDKDYPENPVTAVLAAAIKEAAHNETSFRRFYRSSRRGF